MVVDARVKWRTDSKRERGGEEERGLVRAQLLGGPKPSSSCSVPIRHIVIMK